MTAPTSGQRAQDLLTISHALLLDLPLAAARQVWGLKQEKTLAAATWEAYDASVRAATTAIDALYHTPRFSDAVSSMINQLLRWQHLSTAMNSSLWTTLWQTLGLPTAAEVQALGDHLRTLEARLPRSVQDKPARAVRPPLRASTFSLPGSASAERREGDPHKERAAA